MNENQIPSPGYDPQEPQRRSGNSGRVATVIVVIAILIAGLGVRGLLRLGPAGTGGDMSCDVSAQYENVRIEAVSCDIVFSVGSTDTTSVEYRGPARMTCTAEVHNGTLVIEEKRSGLWLSLMSLFGVRDSKLTVYLPETQRDALKVETVSGNVDLARAGCFRMVEIAAVSGDIELAGTGNTDVTVETVSGDVAIRSGSARSLYVGTTSGDVSVRNLEVDGRVELSTISGEIDFLSSDAQSLDITTTSGDVHTAILSPKDYVTNTVSGDVSVTETQPGAGRCGISTISGDILCE